ncbi:MAG: sulfotransferase [Cyanobacteria bacterium P01_D01_bin.1]
MVQPSFFLVGAPKCGTTAFCTYLDQHPDIFISKPKELNYFDTDFETKRRVSGLSEYLSKFFEGGGRICGEGSTSYLYSRAAAENIYRFNPGAKIIIMLRDPVVVMQSFHSQLLFNGSSENVQDFATAIALEPERKLGRNIPARCAVPDMLLYREVVSFSKQVQRYFDLFGSKQVKVILFEDFRDRTAAVYREALEFVGANPAFEASFGRINSNKKARSSFIQSLVKYPPTSVLEFGKYLLPVPRNWRRYALEKAKQGLKSLNTQKTTRQPVDDALKKRLVAELKPDIQQLEGLISRDLHAWYREA